jgi:hypothetical protein
MEVGRAPSESRRPGGRDRRAGEHRRRRAGHGARVRSGRASRTRPAGRFDLRAGDAEPATGEPFADADEPGEIATCPAGFPPDAIDVDVLRFENNTRYDITGLELQIVGTADEPEPFDFTVNRDPDVNARFGDVNGDGKLGVSDIFETITVSHDEKTIAFADGVIPAGGIFTDYIYSETSDGKPFLAAIDSRFDGEPYRVARRPRLLEGWGP